MPSFVPGLKLSKLFYQKEVKPILDQHFSKLCHSAALIGWGSEVLTYDTPLSRDHHWGPRVLLFLSPKDYRNWNEQLSKVLSNHLPYEFMGYSTHFGKPDSSGVRLPIKIASGPINHMINVYDVRSFFKARLGVDPFKDISVREWLTLPQQRLLELTSGEVFHDGLRELKPVRAKFKYYPKEIWLYMLAAQWTRISQEEAFVGRAGDVGDELGSRIIAARMVREIMRLGFLMEQTYAPYNKWLGTAFNKLRISKKVKPILTQVLSAKTWHEREKSLTRAYSVMAQEHNRLGITKPMETTPVNYYNRPYTVIHAEQFAQAIRLAIKDPEVKKIKSDIGSIDQFTDSTDVVEDPHLRKRLCSLY